MVRWHYLTEDYYNYVVSMTREYDTYGWTWELAVHERGKGKGERGKG